MSKLLKIKAFCLDDIQFHQEDSNFTQKASIDDINKQFRAIYRRKFWIIEGTQSTMAARSYKDADIVVFIQPNPWLRALRILRRSIQRMVKPTKRRESLKGFIFLIRFNFRFASKNNLQNILRRNNKKVKYFKKADDVIEFFKKV